MTNQSSNVPDLVSGLLRDILGRLDDSNEAISGLRLEVAGLKEQVRFANGRTGKLEGRADATETRIKAYEDAQAAAAVAGQKQMARAAGRMDVFQWGNTIVNSNIVKMGLTLGIGVVGGHFLR